MFVSRLALPAVLAAFATSVTAQNAISTQGLTILSPGGPNLWWGALSPRQLFHSRSADTVLFPIRSRTVH